MYYIAVLTEQTKAGQNYIKQITHFCMEKGLFPQIELYRDQEQFFEQIQGKIPTSVLLALHGVAGLNAAEHLRSLYPECGIIWCSDLDFSLHAFRLRIEYFFWNRSARRNLRKAFLYGLKRGKQKRPEHIKNRYRNRRIIMKLNGKRGSRTKTSHASFFAHVSF